MKITVKWNSDADCEAQRITTHRTIEIVAANDQISLNTRIVESCVPQTALSNSAISAESKLREFIKGMLERLGSADYSELNRGNGEMSL